MRAAFRSPHEPATDHEGESAAGIAAVEIALDHLLDDRPEKTALIRLRQGRDLIYQGRALDDLEIAQGCPMIYLESIIKDKLSLLIYDDECQIFLISRAIRAG